MNFIFVINDLGRNGVKAEEILETFLNKNLWLINNTTPHFTKFSPEDKVLIYVAGIGRRLFVAHFTIRSEVYKHKLIPKNDVERTLFKNFIYAINICNINEFKEPICISDIKGDLGFIKDKKYYGLFFRKATRFINDEDYYKILDFRKEKEIKTR